MDNEGDGKRPAIPQQERTKRHLREIEDCFRGLLRRRKGAFESREQLFRSRFPYSSGQSLSFGDMEEHHAHLEILGEIATELVHLDKTQLHHPIVQLIMRGLTSKEFLRKLHRGLETGVKRGIESIKGVVGKTEEERYRNSIVILNVIKKDRNMLPWDLPDAYTEDEKQRLQSWRKRFLQKLEKGTGEDAAEQARKEKLARDVEKIFPWDADKSAAVPYAQIQEELEGRELIKPMTRQAFHKMVQRLMALSAPSAPAFNLRALPPRPEQTPPEWKRAEELVEEWTKEG